LFVEFVIVLAYALASDRVESIEQDLAFISSYLYSCKNPPVEISFVNDSGTDILLLCPEGI
jgi:hypothetical protein